MLPLPRSSFVAATLALVFLCPIHEGSALEESCAVDSPCLGGKFCNFDNDSSGFCEDCPDAGFDILSACSSMGLSSSGVVDCQSFCKVSSNFVISSPFEIFRVDDDGGCEVPREKSKQMKSRGFTKVACPFGVLVAGTEGYNDERLKFAANVIAEILDQDMDGVVDDPDLVGILTYRGKSHGGALLQCGTSHEEEKRGDELGSVFDYAFSCQTWYARDLAEFKGIMMEEAFHLVHQEGYAKIYPEELGIEDYTSSVISRETARLQCVKPGWVHPENTCPADSPRQPGNPAQSPLIGTCNEPSCDIAEFYKMVLFLVVGMGEESDPGGPVVWLSEYTPGRKEEVLLMLSEEFKEMISRPSLHQLSAPLTGNYDASPSMPEFEPSSAAVLTTSTALLVFAGTVLLHARFVNGLLAQGSHA